MIKVFDTSAILTIVIEAEKPKIFEMLVDEGYQIYIPKEVYKEINDISSIGQLLKNSKIDLIPKINDAEIQAIKDRYQFFHDGEISVIIHGQNLQKQGVKCRCIIDEKDAKKYAKSNSLQVNGVLGLLLWLKAKKKINKEECIEIYNKLIKNPRLPCDLLEKLKDDN